MTPVLGRQPQWGLRAFGQHSSELEPAQLLRYVVPERTDITSLAAWPQRPGPQPLALDIVALVPVADDGTLADAGRVQLALAVVQLGEVVPTYRAHAGGPRSLGPHPFNRLAWVYFLGADTLLGGAAVWDEHLRMRPTVERSESR